MKKIIASTASLLLVTLSINAQVLNPTSLPKTALKATKKSEMSMTSKMEMQGQSMAIENAMTIKSAYTVSAITAAGGSAEMKVTAMKMNMSAMGQDMSYDSEHPEEGGEEMGPKVKEVMKEPTKVKLDAKGKIKEIAENKALEELNEQASAMKSLTKGKYLDIFIDIPKAIKVGDKWKDSTITTEQRIVNTYTYKSFAAGVATIEQLSSIKTDGKIEKQGMTGTQKMDGTMTSTVLVNAKNLQIKSRKTKGKIKGEINMASMEIPMEIDMTVTETIE